MKTVICFSSFLLFLGILLQLAQNIQQRYNSLIHSKMILNCKVFQSPQLPLQKQSPYTLHSRKPADQSQSGTPKEDSFQTCTDTRKVCVQPENCHFKIRTFSTRSSNKRTSIEGKYVKNVLVVQGNKKVKFQPKEELLTALTNKCLEGQKYSRNYVMRPKRQNKNDTVFNAITIIKTNDKKSIAFKQQNYSFLKPLAHKPFIKLNQTESGNSSSSLVLIISLRCLNNEPVKYWKNNDKGFYSQKSVMTEASELTLQTMNLLRTLSGSATQDSWLGQCQLFYKADNCRQMDLVYNYLIDNNLLCFAGVINCEKKVSETYNIFSIQSVVSKDSHCLLIQDYQTLKTQFPLLQGHRFACISPKAANYANIYPFVSCLKDASYQIGFKQSIHQKSCHLDTEKENLNTNIYSVTLLNCQSKQLSHSQSQNMQKCSKVELSIGVNLQKDFINLQMSKLVQMAKQALKIKEIRRAVKQVRQKSVENRISSAQSGVKKPVFKDKCNFRDQSMIGDEQSPQVGRFQGQFKEKLVKLVKILENEKKELRIPRRSFCQSKRQSDTQGKKQQNDLQFLTECLTSKLKCKTGYQLVGDLVKSNMHINRQINKYLNNVKGVGELLEKDKRYFNTQIEQQVTQASKKAISDTSLLEKEQALPIYFF